MTVVSVVAKWMVEDCEIFLGVILYGWGGRGIIVSIVELDCWRDRSNEAI